MTGNEELDGKRYFELKKIASEIQHVEDGDLVPNNPKYYSEIINEINELEHKYPYFNFAKNL